jgi:hypothetical protein
MSAALDDFVIEAKRGDKNIRVLNPISLLASKLDIVHKRPEARYFAVGKLAKDQVEDLARRKNNLDKFMAIFVGDFRWLTAGHIWTNLGP